MYLLRRLIFIFALSTSTQVSADSSIRPFFNSETFLYSEPVSLDAVRNDWNGRYWENGEKQIGRFSVEAGIRKGAWTLSSLYREHHYFDFSADTADLYYGVENNLALDTDRTYQLDLEAYQMRGAGLRLHRQFNIHPSLTAGIGLSIFKASRLLEGKLTGQANSRSDDEYDFQIQVDTQYAEDPLFDRRLDDELSGRGLALDADLNWQPTDKLRVELKAHDIAGLVRWDDVPFTTAQANSNNVVINDAGFTQVNPLLSGTEGFNERFSQRLKPFIDASLSYGIGATTYAGTAAAKYTDGVSLFGLGLTKRHQDGSWSLNYWPKTGVAEFGITDKQLGLSIGIDDTDKDDIRTAWLSVSYGTGR